MPQKVEHYHNQLHDLEALLTEKEIQMTTFCTEISQLRQELTVAYNKGREEDPEWKKVIDLKHDKELEILQNEIGVLKDERDQRV